MIFLIGVFVSAMPLLIILKFLGDKHIAAMNRLDALEKEMGANLDLIKTLKTTLEGKP